MPGSCAVTAGTVLGSLPCRLALWSRRALPRRRRTAPRTQEAARRAAQQAVAAERQRLARDLHDVLGHSLSLMVVQAGGAAQVLRHDPDRALAALEQVDTLGRQAVDELRTLLGLLGTTAPDAPAPVRSDDLDRLVARLRASGQPVELRLHGAPPAGLQPGTDLAVYRLVQESLTNALRHGDARHAATVEVTWRPDDVTVEVANHAAPGEDGACVLSLHQGVDGMRARAASVGGRLSAREDQNGVYRVVAVLPTRLADAAPAGPPACCETVPVVRAVPRPGRRLLSTVRSDGPSEPLAEQRAA